jgi:hypothetical protein
MSIKDILMNGKEREAFEKAYNGNVAIGDREQVSKFLDRYYSDEDGETLNKDFPHIYSTLVDHICTWNSAKDYTELEITES